METNNKSTRILNELAEVTDKLQNLFEGKITVVFELQEGVYNSVLTELNGMVITNNQFKIDISGTDFIFLKDVS
jgi:hypothetical protein